MYSHDTDNWVHVLWICSVKLWTDKRQTPVVTSCARELECWTPVHFKAKVHRRQTVRVTIIYYSDAISKITIRANQLISSSCTEPDLILCFTSGLFTREALMHSNIVFNSPPTCPTLLGDKWWRASKLVEEISEPLRVWEESCSEHFFYFWEICHLDAKM